MITNFNLPFLRLFTLISLLLAVNALPRQGAVYPAPSPSSSSWPSVTPVATTSTPSSGWGTTSPASAPKSTSDSWGSTSASASASASASPSPRASASSSTPTSSLTSELTGGQNTCSKGRSAKNAVCCVWYDVLDDIQANLFSGGQCDEGAHDSLRLTFHDAIGFSSSLFSQGQWGGGGADGSIIAHSDVEMQWGFNDGLQDIVEEQRGIADKHGVSYGDIIQFAGAVSVRNCAGGPKIQFLSGRSHQPQASPPNLVPEAFHSVSTILARMADAGFSANELVDLLASHSIGFQENVDTNPNVAGTPFDTTPQVLDSQFYLEVMLKGTVQTGGGTGQMSRGEALSPIPGEFRLESDRALARDSRTSCRWEEWAAQEANMQSSFATAMAKLAITGQDPSKLVDCSDVIPAAQPYTPKLPSLPPTKQFSDIEFSCPNPDGLNGGLSGLAGSGSSASGSSQNGKGQQPNRNKGWQTIPGSVNKLPTKFQLFVLALTTGLALADLKSDLTGVTTMFPGSSGYADASKAFNRRFSFQPAAIAFPTTANQVAQIVKAGAANGMKIVARGGGHSYVANGLGGESGTLVVDMSNMKAINIDSSDNTVQVQMGNRLGDIALALNAAGRALPHGTCPYVGIGGHSSFGGYGFTSRQWGLALDPITTINAVLANGTRVSATKSQNSDLFWALRGAAPSFAITTSIKLNTFPVPSHAIGFSYTWELDYKSAADAFLAYQSYSLAGPPSVMGSELNIGRGSTRGTISISLVGGWYAPEKSNGGIQHALKPFLDQMPAPNDHKMLGNGTYIDTVVQFGGSEDAPEGGLNTRLQPDGTDTFYAKSLMTTMGSPVSKKAFRAFAKYLSEEGFDSDTNWFMQIEQYGGPNSAINTPSSDSTAFFRRDVLFTWQLYASSSDSKPPYPADGFTFVDGVANSVTDNMPADWDYGAYTNYIDIRLEDWQQRYYGSNYPRLQKIKRAVDPNNVFEFPTSIEL
ncbi:hypothetical protein D9758_012984 [Tetrapyrgos nigripes]|uniref:Peroxidase n=1 Tax=Tetrapyrgos nigripes TaxID=182062 RepID=A0A8H5CKP8_9AGAR|nr:hypothetical protein D9758_012984 [Tetrapyrgos nigripes]